jgi:hypothetical protein
MVVFILLEISFTVELSFSVSSIFSSSVIDIFMSFLEIILGYDSC